ncbi:rhodanese-like domain-containing protein [Microlunatus panaciterrae]|uniref:Rhodanese-related sulfurtransferase n=1 Tax=Microlunatus panaciterrae TaxID=400768 RepID=A0ABS2RJY9_9ACTN|nr:rhodanese-like domain-containing protein [Microlunatus panaciterrae]MBM7798978.1 rhodanese-related sulfurtransferase [Microlunatus panaciterrae]
MMRKLQALLGRPPSLTATEAHQSVEDDRAVLLDVRETNEWRAGHAPQALHITLSTLETRLEEIPTGRPIVTVCRSGRRSAAAANVLIRRGYEVANLTGGMNAWAAAGLPVITARNKPGQII